MFSFETQRKELEKRKKQEARAGAKSSFSPKKKDSSESTSENSKTTPETNKTTPSYINTKAKDLQGNIINWQWLMKNFIKCSAMTTTGHPCKPFFGCMIEIANPQFKKLTSTQQKDAKEKCAAQAAMALNSDHMGNLNIGKCDTKFCYEK